MAPPAYPTALQPHLAKIDQVHWDDAAKAFAQCVTSVPLACSDAKNEPPFVARKDPQTGRPVLDDRGKEVLELRSTRHPDPNKGGRKITYVDACAEAVASTYQVAGVVDAETFRPGLQGRPSVTIEQPRMGRSIWNDGQQFAGTQRSGNALAATAPGNKTYINTIAAHFCPDSGGGSDGMGGKQVPARVQRVYSRVFGGEIDPLTLPPAPLPDERVSTASEIGLALYTPGAQICSAATWIGSSGAIGDQILAGRPEATLDASASPFAAGDQALAGGLGSVDIAVPFAPPAIVPAMSFVPAVAPAPTPAVVPVVP